MIGENVRHYKIEEKIGEGGMGVVYRAEDTKLKRTVALKFLPPESTRSAEARERFIHEAQAASALDHPNICTIYEIDETDEGQVYIAMGLYEGQTLREKIAERPLKLEDAIDITTQIAHGLAKAHEQKIIHRDIKPANIFITTEGQVKILDFGIAKLAGQTKLTLTGTTIGTVSYMAPEQAKGDEADHKADIWSLGVLMYEMLTGQQPFRGEHEQAIIYSILNEEPEPITALRTGIPIDLEWIVQKALKKDPRQRYQHIDEIPVDLEAVEERRISASRISAVSLPSAEVSPPTFINRKLKVGIIISGIILALITGYSFRGLFTPDSEHSSGSMTRFDVTVPNVVLRGSGSQIAVSPDGNYIIFQINDLSIEADNYQRFFIRSMDATEVSPLTGSDQWPLYPTFSPNSEWVGFFDYNDKIIKKIDLGAGTHRVTPICETGVANLWGMDWGPDDTIIYAPRGSGKLMLVSSLGGTPWQIAIQDTANQGSPYRWPQFLPGGKDVLLTLFRSSPDSSHIAALTLKTGKLKSLTGMGTTYPRYIPSIRHLLYVRDGIITIAPFNYKQLKLTGREIATSECISFSIYGAAYFGISSTGLLVYAPGAADLVPSIGQENLVWVDRSGIRTQIDIEPRNFNTQVSLSPDADKLAVAVENESEAGNADIWVFGVDGSSPTRLTYEGNNVRPSWTPDGKNIMFISGPQGNYDTYMKAADGTGEKVILLGSTLSEVGSSWSPDGTTLAYYVVIDDSNRDIWILDIDGEPQPVLTTPHNERNPVFSPVGKWIAYVSNDNNNQDEVYVVPLPGSGITGRWQVSEGGGTEPRWAPDGSRIYYRDGNMMMEVEVDLTPIFIKKGSPRVIYRSGGFPRHANRTTYDIHPNGDRFLMISTRSGNEVASTVHMVTNWFEELKRLEGGR